MTLISAEQVAWLIVDALVDAGIVARESAASAAAIAKTEIEVRLSLGNTIVEESANERPQVAE